MKAKIFDVVVSMTFSDKVTKAQARDALKRIIRNPSEGVVSEMETILDCALVKTSILKVSERT